LLLLSFIKDINATCFGSSSRYATREVGELVKLIEVLSSLKQNLLVFGKVVVGVQVCVSQDCNVFLKVFNLIVQIDEFLSLLFHE
jgi:hypothetical protein